MQTIMPAALALALAVSACAPVPSEIKPVASGADYSALTCSQAKSRLAHEEAQLAAHVAQQEKSARNDAIGVAVIGVPVSSVSGNNRKEQIAVGKGRVIALKARVARCS